MSRIIYNSNLRLTESYIIIYRIYVLKNPFTGEVFYVGKTMKELKDRLTGHLSSLNSNGSNQTKNEYIQDILGKGNRPTIEEVEIIYGTCYIHSLYASYREFYWMNYYKNLGVNLVNHIGVKTDAVCFDYEKYVRGVKEGNSQYSYYYCGKTTYGDEVYDGEKMEEDGFLFEKETKQQYELKSRVVEITYDPIYDDEHQDYIRGSLEEI